MLHQIDLSRTDLNLFVLFEAVLREGHVGRAASLLQLSPSAVSHGLGRLRRLLGDPLFLRTPKGVVPTARALELAGPIAEILAGARRVVASSEPFDPGTSTRAFTIGAPDGTTAFLLPLMERLSAEAPRVGIRLRQLLPSEGGQEAGPAWAPVLAHLDARAIDLAIGPFENVPARFETRDLWHEDFVIASRVGHSFALKPDLSAYCAAGHVVVSQTGDAHGFVDLTLVERGLSRRVALTVPGFFMALAVVSATDLLTALPRSFADTHGGSLAITEPPLPLLRFQLKAVLPKAALADVGIAWLLAALASTIQ
jgi:DNA-binding transcriptional LysR family regulator